jgi:hypothetical protein
VLVISRISSTGADEAGHLLALDPHGHRHPAGNVGLAVRLAVGDRQAIIAGVLQLRLEVGLDGLAGEPGFQLA